MCYFCKKFNRALMESILEVSDSSAICDGADDDGEEEEEEAGDQDLTISTVFEVNIYCIPSV